jgi:hypothetical protein
MPKKKPVRFSGQHLNPRFPMSASAEEIAEWDRVASSLGTNRTAWLRSLANAAAAAAPRSVPLNRTAAWREARAADVIAVAEKIRGLVIGDKAAITPAQLENLLAEHSGFQGWRVTFDGPEFEAKPPSMPKNWKP